MKKKRVGKRWVPRLKKKDKALVRDWRKALIDRGMKPRDFCKLYHTEIPSKNVFTQAYNGHVNLQDRFRDAMTAFVAETRAMVADER